MSQRTIGAKCTLCKAEALYESAYTPFFALTCSISTIPSVRSRLPVRKAVRKKRGFCCRISPHRACLSSFQHFSPSRLPLGTPCNTKGEGPIFMNAEFLRSPKSRAIRRTRLTIDRDVPLLYFLWRWKLSTTSAIVASFFPNLSVGTAYRRLWRLEQGGFIRCRSDESGKLFLWTLDKRGFAVEKATMPPMREEGYLSENMVHDAIVSAIHLGDGLVTNNNAIEHFTEQELRRVDPEHYPEWISKYATHRPDGYWRVTEGDSQRIIALEVELSLKKDFEYESVGRHYDRIDKADDVIWIIDRPSCARKIHRMTSVASRKPNKHSFIELSHIYSQGWQATVSFGKQTGKSLASMVSNTLTTNYQHVVTLLMLDARKSPQRSTRCRFVTPPSFSDYIRISQSRNLHLTDGTAPCLG